MNKKLDDQNKLENEDFRLPYSVDIFLPPTYKQVIEELVRFGQGDADIFVIHDALWQMRNSEMTKEELKAELIALLKEGIESEPKITVTQESWDEYWDNFIQRCKAHSEWLKTQNIGNTLLPKELHQYIQDKIASGKYANATEVVCAALDTFQNIKSLS